LKRTLRILLWLVLANLPRQAWAIDSCSQCVLGIWDDPALSSNVGEIVAGQPKDIYVGIKFAEGFNQTIGISFSVDGLSRFLVMGVEPIVPTASACDDLSAPADTSQVGGCNFYWPGCLVGSQALLRVTLLTSSNITNGLLQVKREYPPSHPDARSPIFYQCNSPLYTPTRVKGGYYILNWDGDPTVRVDGAPWSIVKQLYR
jgi:hypothetical protein